MADPQLLAQALMVPKQPLPQSFYNPEETNPLVKALMKEPSIPNPSDPPHWARQAVVDAVRPVLDAGQWLGGVMGGNIQPTMGDAVTNLGGAALAGVLPPGARGAKAAERAAEPLAQMAEHGLFDLGSSPDKISAVASRYGGKIYTGTNHAAAAESAAKDLGVPFDELMKNYDINTDGYLTSSGRFVNRAEAAKIAKDSDQIGLFYRILNPFLKKAMVGHLPEGEPLMSEELKRNTLAKGLSQ